MSFDRYQTASYITQLFAAEDEALNDIRRQSAEKNLPAISICAEEGRFLQWMVRACGARLALEIGTLGGYSGAWIARGLPPDGKLISIEKESRHASIARQNLAHAGLSERVEIWEGGALTLLPLAAERGAYDFVFIDADKPSYALFLDWALEHTRQGGVIAAHNAFRKGGVFDPLDNEEGAVIMRAFNQRFANEPRLLGTIYPGGDGILLGVKVG